MALSIEATALAGATRDVAVSADDGQNVFAAAYVEQARWKGWECPWFRESEGQRIAAMSARWDQIDGVDPGAVEVFQYHPENPPGRRFICVPPEGHPYPEDALPDPARPGEYVYGIGNRNWTWQAQCLPATRPGRDCRYEPVEGDPAIRVCVVHDPDFGLYGGELCARVGAGALPPTQR